MIPIFVLALERSAEPTHRASPAKRILNWPADDDWAIAPLLVKLPDNFKTRVLVVLVAAIVPEALTVSVLAELGAADVPSTITLVPDSTTASSLLVGTTFTPDALVHVVEELQLAPPAAVFVLK